MLNVVVSTVDSRLEFALHKNSLGKQLFEQVVKTLGIREVWYFGIQYTDKENNLCWLKLDKKVTSHELSKEKPPVFFFRVKFYPEDVVEELIEDITREFFYLQVKSSILKGDIYCPAETAVLLASYVCHVRIGVYGPGCDASVPTADRLLPPSVLEAHELSSDEWRERIINCYKQHKELSKEDAILEYLKICQDLEMYGVTYYQIKNKKGTKLWLGIDAMGLNIYENEDKLTPKIGFPWDEVKKVSFKSKKFILLPTDKSAKEWHFLVERVRFNRQILSLSIGNHELYIRRRKPDSIEVQQMKTKAQEIREAKAMDKKRLNEERSAREEMEKKVKIIEQESIKNREEYEEAIRVANKYEKELELLKSELDKEREAKMMLASTEDQLRQINQQLEMAVAATAEERERLRAEHRTLEERVAQQTEQLEFQKKMNIERTRDLDSLKEKATIPFLLVSDKNNNCSTNGLDQFEEINNNNLEAEPEDDIKELEVLEHIQRSEEERITEYEKNKELSNQIKTLRADLQNKRDVSKLKPIDHRYDELQKKGLDKFKTLRQIREGNTKKRVDQFEAM